MLGKLKPVELYYVDGALTLNAGVADRARAAVTLRVDQGQMTDNYAFARLAEALKHFTSQNQWPPVPTRR